MSSVVRYEGHGLRVGDARMPVRREAFDDPALIQLMLDQSVGQPVRLLRFLLEDDEYDKVRSVILSADGDRAEHARAIIQTIIKGECPELMTLIWMAHEHLSELSFDFKRFLSVDLDKALKKRSPRQLAQWAVAMPAEGSLNRAINPDWRWGLNEQLLAGVYDSLSFLRWEAAKLAGAKPGKTPEQLERPGVKPNKDVTRVGQGEGFETISEWDAWYADQKARMKPAPE